MSSSALSAASSIEKIMPETFEEEDEVRTLTFFLELEKNLQSDMHDRALVTFPGIGKKTAEKLNAVGVKNFEDLLGVFMQHSEQGSHCRSFSSSFSWLKLLRYHRAISRISEVSLRASQHSGRATASLP